MSEGKLVRLAKKKRKKKQENRQRYRSSLLSIACFGHFRFCLVYLYCVYGKVVCHRARRLERKNRLSREERKRKETERVRKRERKRAEEERREKRTDRKLRRSDGGRADIAAREMGEKRLISVGGLSAGDIPRRHIAKRSICSVPTGSLGPPSSSRTHTDAHSHFAVSDFRVTTAFYKVRDFSAGMCIRVPPRAPPRARSIFLVLGVYPPSRFLFIRFPLELLSSYLRSQCVSISVRRRALHVVAVRAWFAKSRYLEVIGNTIISST